MEDLKLKPKPKPKSRVKPNLKNKNGADSNADYSASALTTISHLLKRIEDHLMRTQASLDRIKKNFGD